MVVAGLYAVTNPITQHIEEWKKAVQSLDSKIDEECLFRAPTPVCFELMCWNNEWKKKVLNGKLALFNYANYSIVNKVLLKAADYRIKAQASIDGKTHKIKSLDPIIAAYAILYNHYLLTTNQEDYPESFFEVINCEVMKFRGKDGKYSRQVLYLLKPR